VIEYVFNLVVEGGGGADKFSDGKRGKRRKETRQSLTIKYLREVRGRRGEDGRLQGMIPLRAGRMFERGKRGGRRDSRIQLFLSLQRGRVERKGGGGKKF